MKNTERKNFNYKTNSINKSQSLTYSGTINSNMNDSDLSITPYPLTYKLLTVGVGQCNH
jgi:hypothetical protein